MFKALFEIIIRHLLHYFLLPLYAFITCTWTTLPFATI